MWNGFSFLSFQQVVTTNITSSPILGKANATTPFKKSTYGSRQMLLCNKDTSKKKKKKRSWTLDYDWDDVQVLGQFLLLAVLKKADYYRSSVLDIVSNFLPQSALHLQPTWEDAFVSVLRNWRIGTLLTGIQRTLKTTHLLFAPGGPQTFPKIYLHDSEINGIIASHHLVTVIWTLMVRFILSSHRP